MTVLGQRALLRQSATLCPLASPPEPLRGGPDKEDRSPRGSSYDLVPQAL